MKKTSLLWFVGIVLIITIGLLPATIGTSFATSASLIRVYTGADEKPTLELDPPALYVQSGSVVIWVNGVMNQEVKVVFKDGKACQDVAISPKFKGFQLDSKSCFVTTFLPYASTSSLQFTDVGTFEYEIVTDDGKMTTKGQVVVRK